MKKFEFYNNSTGEIADNYNDLTIEEGDEITVYLNGVYFYSFVFDGWLI